MILAYRDMDLKFQVDTAHRKRGPRAAAFMRAALDPKQQSVAAVFAVDYLKQHKLTPSTTVLAKIQHLTVELALERASAAAWKFVESPSRATHSNWLKQSVSIANVTLRASDSRRATLPTLHQTADLPPLIEPALSRAPSTALDWQTHPAIGVNPESVAMLRDVLRGKQDSKSIAAICEADFLRAMVKTLEPAKAVSTPPRAKKVRLNQFTAAPELRPACVTTFPKLKLSSR